MCVHASWMKTEHCTRCHPRPNPHTCKGKVGTACRACAIADLAAGRPPQAKTTAKPVTKATPQMSRVLKALGDTARLSEQQIADLTGDPLPSIRRSIQQLIHLGHRVTYAGDDGCYALTH